METRRSFLKGAGILGAFLAGTITYEKDNRLWIKVGDEWKRVALEA